ncbi:MAG: crossover junction endodeoxyribonuclease RuvC [Candidatus Omnitrophica bacterium]|nr:crossover junction endodeoxyribonuclease RuvC [Candidatus Omnitrophota bacterium]
MKILGIDPGLNITGYGLVEVYPSNKIKLIEAGVVRTSGKIGISERLKKIYNNIGAIVREFKPETLVLEKLYSHYKHPTTSILMSHARGVICLLCGLNDIKLISYPSTRIKKAVAGNGHASKVQIQKMVTELLRLKKPPEPVDVTDALALALSFVYIELRRPR